MHVTEHRQLGARMRHTVTLERYPLPPEDLRRRAIGAREETGYVESIRADIDFLEHDVLAKEGKSFRDFGTIVDFGCGAGRLIQPIREYCPLTTKIYGVDTDRTALDWCKGNIRDVGFSLTDEWPPLSYRDKSVDLIIAYSVFTHLDQEHQFRWMAELNRIIKPNGYLLITFRNKYNLEQIADAAVRERIEADRGGIAFVPGDPAKGVPAWYGETYHTPEYVRKNWGSFFELRQTIPVGAIPEETAVLRARESTFLQRFFQRP